MRHEFFLYLTPKEPLIGILRNIPDEISADKVKERMEAHGSEGEIYMLNEKEYNYVDIEMQWETLDKEEGEALSLDWLAVSDALDAADKNELQVEVVYFALKAMKENSTLSIADAIKIGINEWVK